MRTHEEYSSIVELLTAQGSPSITEDVLMCHTTLVDDFHQEGTYFPCLGLPN